MVVVLMGVSGSGKTTVGRMLACALNWEFLDGDELHPAANRAKMQRGIALTDADRLPWLQRVRELIEESIRRGTNAVVACSALKKSYRDIIVVDPAQVPVVYLKGSSQLIARRLANRTGHFMPATLLPSQFEALEEPADAISVDVALTPEQLVSAIRTRLGI